MKKRLLAVCLTLVLVWGVFPAGAVIDCGDADGYSFDGSVYLSYPLSLYSQFPNGETPWHFGYILHSDTTNTIYDMTKYLNNWSHDYSQDGASGNFTYGTIGVEGNGFHPGGNADPVLTFTCPYDGEILLPEAEVYSHANSPDGTKIKLTLNDYYIFPSDGWQLLEPGVRHTFPETKLKVKAGDILRWQVNKNGDQSTDSTYWPGISVSYVSDSQNAVGLGNGVVSPLPSDIEYITETTSPTQYHALGENGAGGWYFQNCEVDTDNYLNLDRFNGGWSGGWGNNWTPGLVSSGTNCHPGEGGDSVWTYVCPKDGLIAIPETTVSSNSATGTDGVRARILNNATPVYPASGWVMVNPGTVVTIPELLLEVKAGDELHFRVNCNNDQDADGTTWSNIGLRYVECESYVPVSFTDISGHWAEETILEMYEAGILSGRSDTLFAPDEPVTRAEFFSMAVRAAQYTEADFTDTFSDVHFTSWYARPIITAFQNNLIDYGMIAGDKVYPEQGITREEAASVLVNAHKIKKRKAVDNADLTGYTDAASITAWARDYMEKAVTLGFMQGDNNALTPTAVLTRAEAAQLLASLKTALATEDPDGTLSKVHQDADGNYLPVYQNTDLEKLIMDAYNAGETSVTIPKGVYRMDAKVNGLAVHLKELKNFTINANDVVLSYKSAANDLMRIEDCENVKIYGLTLDHEYSSLYQGTIEAIDPNGMYFEVKIDPAYVPNMLNTRFVSASTSTAMFLHPDGSLIPWTGARSLDGNIRKVGNDLYRVYIAKHEENEHVSVNDLFCGRALSGNNLTITGCSGLYFEDLTIYNGFNGIFESNAEQGSTYENLRIVPGPKYETATMERLRSVNGTGYFVRATRKGATINNSEISRTNDDGINVHASYDRVAAVEGNNTYVIAAASSTDAFRVGDELRFTSQDGIVRGEALVTSSEKLSGYTPSANLTGFSAGGGYYRVVLGAEIPGAAFNDRSCNLSTLSTGMKITNSRFEGNSPRAILTHALDSTIENCEFVNVRRWAIEAAPELPTWNEGDYMRNLTIKGCNFTGNGRGTDELMAAIGIWGDHANGSRGNENIKILNNTFSGQYRYDIVLSYVDGATVSGNTFNAQPDDLANYENLKATESINLFNAANVTFSNDNDFTSERTPFKVDYAVGTNDWATITGLPEKYYPATETE